MEESWDGCEILQSDVAETPMNKEKMTQKHPRQPHSLEKVWKCSECT